MLKNSEGKSSSSITFAWISFIYVLVAVTAGLIEDLTIGTFNIKFRMIDAAIILCLLGPTFSLYGFRRHTESKKRNPKPQVLDDGEDLKKS